MSEKAACPRCDAYVSQVYYDGRHEWCGWNCDVDYIIRAYGSVGHAKLAIKTKPTAGVCDAVAALAGADDTTVDVLVDGYQPERLSPWLDPGQEDPKPLSERKQKANVSALKRRRLADAKERVEREFG